MFQAKRKQILVKNMNVKWKMHLSSSSITTLVSDKEGGLDSRGDDTPMSIRGIPWVRRSLRLLEDTSKHNLLQAALLSVLQVTMMVILLASLATQ